MKKKKIEICASGLGSAIEAEKGGADRIELCSALAVGGLTPSAGLIEETRKRLKIPIFPLIRCREGDFCYSSAEVEAMCRDIVFARNAGCEGVVVGALKPTGELDLTALRKMARAAEGIEMTIHRCFDFTRNPLESLQKLIDLGAARVLTSGQRPTAPEGTGLIARLVEAAAERLSIMPGSGVNVENLAALAAATGAREFHFTARKNRVSAFLSTDEALGALDFDWLETDAATVREARRQLGI